MRELLLKIGWTPDVKEPPNFVAIISQKAKEEPLIEFAGLVRTKNAKNWYLKTKYTKGDVFEHGLPVHPHWGNVFVSYSHKDKEWMELFRDMLSPLIDAEKISFWSDEHITPGQQWEKEIDKAMKSAKVAVLLVSLNFLKSDFIKNIELPYLLKAAEKEHVKLFWILVSNCLYEETPLVKYHAANDTRRPLDTIQNKGEATSVVKKICEKLTKVVKDTGDL